MNQTQIRRQTTISDFNQHIDQFQLTKCHICLEKFNHQNKLPKTMCLQYLHVICSVCFQKFIQSQNQIRCTICRDTSHFNLFDRNHINRIILKVLQFEDVMNKKYKEDLLNKEEQIKNLKKLNKKLKEEMNKEHQQKQKLKLLYQNLRFQYNSKYQKKISQALFKLEKQNKSQNKLKFEQFQESKKVILQRVSQYQDQIVQYRHEMKGLLRTILMLEQKQESLLKKLPLMGQVRQDQQNTQQNLNSLFNEQVRIRYKKNIEKQMKLEYQQVQNIFQNLKKIIQSISNNEKKTRKASQTSSNCATIHSQSQIQQEF